MLRTNGSRNPGIARPTSSPRRLRDFRPQGVLSWLERLEDRTLLSFNVTISSAASSNVAVSGASTVTFTPTANNANLNAGTIQGQLNLGRTVIVNTAPGSGSQAGDITVTSSILKSAGGTATCNCRRRTRSPSRAAATLPRRAAC